MARLKWDQVGERTYETGVDHGILFLQKAGAYPKGVAWSGLTQVTESPSGAESNAFYADNMKYLEIRSAEDFGATIECYTYPDEWDFCNGEAELAPGVKIGQQRRSTFGFAYRSKVGNDTDGTDSGYKLHLIYGATASPAEKGYGTVNESPEPITFSYEVTTTPVPVSGKDADGKPLKPTAILTFDSTKVDPAVMKAIEDVIEGTEDTESRLPLPDEIKEIIDGVTITTPPSDEDEEP